MANRKLAKGGAVHDIVRPVSTPPKPVDTALVERVAVAITRAASVVPWRADCLRQATAANRWLMRAGISTEIRLGAFKDEQGQLNAHAWLLCGGNVLIGGAVEQFQEFD